MVIFDQWSRMANFQHRLLCGLFFHGKRNPFSFHIHFQDGDGAVSRTNLDSGVHVVVGTSGLRDEDYEEINQKALDKKLGVLAVGNFALTVVLLHKFYD